MNAIIVCVDYSDLLGVTLPYNRHHFDRVMIVTTPTDSATIKVASQNQADVCITTCFYDDGAFFNKGKAFEKGFDQLGRYGWLCVMDADILWPKVIPQQDYQRGFLYTPFRNLWPATDVVPVEAVWGSGKTFPGDEYGWVGYTQIFHAEDPHLPQPPWHSVRWKHAGGVDSEFEAMWPITHKVRPSWKVLHLGEAGVNWCGRTTPLLTGELPTEASDRKQALRQLMMVRRLTCSYENELLKD